MKRQTLLLVFIFSIVFIHCKNEKQTTDKTTIKDISELTYMEIYRQLFLDANGGFDAHGDLYGREAISDLTISEEDSSCGKALFLINNSTEKEITLAIEANFNFPGNPNTKMVRAYTVKPSGKIAVGNSILCYNNKEYPVNRKIISAGYTADQSSD